MKIFKTKIFSLQIVRFVLVGGISTAIDFIIYMLLSMKLPVEISKGISMVSASVFSYFANKNYTFKNKDKTNIGYIIKFYIVFAANLAANIAINSLLYHSTGYKVLSFIIATLAGMTVNYVGQKIFVFSKDDKE